MSRTVRSGRSWSAACPRRSGGSESIAGGEFLAASSDSARTRTISRSTSTGSERAWLDRSSLESAIVVRLQHKERDLGALVMMSEIADVSLNDRLVFAEAVGHQVSVALTLTKAFADSETAARVAREHAALLESVFTSINDPIVVVDSDGHASTWNQAARELVGADALHHQIEPYPNWSKHIGVFHADKVTPFSVEERPIFRALRGESVERVDAFLTYPAKPDGAWVSLAARPLRDDRGQVRGAVAVSRDVTAERLAHEQLMISDRMASIGMMAAGVGHEINNPLSAVVANLEMAVAEVAALADRLAPNGLAICRTRFARPTTPPSACGASRSTSRCSPAVQADENAAMNVEDVLDSAVRMGWNQVRNRAKVVKRYGRCRRRRRGIAPRPGVPQFDRQRGAGDSRRTAGRQRDPADHARRRSGPHRHRHRRHRLGHSAACDAAAVYAVS